MTEQANKVVTEIIEDLTGRKGLRQEWEQIEGDIQQEISNTWAGIVDAALTRDVVSKDTIAMTLTSALLSGFTVAVDCLYALQMPKMTRERLVEIVSKAVPVLYGSEADDIADAILEAK